MGSSDSVPSLPPMDEASGKAYLGGRVKGPSFKGCLFVISSSVGYFNFYRKHVLLVE